MLNCTQSTTKQLQHEATAAGGSYTQLSRLLQPAFAPTQRQLIYCSDLLCCRGNVLELLDDIQELKPHMFCSVPRLWNRIYDRVNATIQASNPISRKLFETAYKSKKAALDRGDLSGGKMAGFWDKLVFSKIKARIGGMGCTLYLLHCVQHHSQGISSFMQWLMQMLLDLPDIACPPDNFAKP